MKKLILFVFTTIGFKAQAQPEFVERIGFKLESIADMDIGWMKVYKYPSPPKGKQLGNRIYSARQIGYCQQFIEWMQQSYLPKGCLGDAGYYLNEIPKFSGTNSKLGNEINQHSHALPHMYGAFSRMYTALKKDAQGKFAPLYNFAEYWRIEANQLQYISSPVSFISSPEQYYFILPDYGSHPKGYDDDDKAMINLRGFNDQENLKPHKHFYIPPKIIDDYPHFLVIMTRDHELPFEKITIGEFFTQVEKQMPVWQKIVPLSADNYALAQKNLARLKEKYRNKWNDVAELKTSGTQIGLYDFVNAGEDRPDMFDNKDINGKEGVYTTFPIMKVKKSALELCKTDKPQWLVIRWTLGMPRQPFNIHMHESILKNFNFDYVYNYFFDPEKVKGQAYKPLRSPYEKEVDVISELSENARKNKSDKNIHFYEDFSSTAAGNKPIGWKTGIGAGGSYPTVTRLEGLPGNWVMMNGDYSIIPNLVKKPFPENFTLSYELVAAQNFTWGAKGLLMKLSKETSPGNAESYLSLRLRPGFDGRDGEATLETKFTSPPGYSDQTKWLKAPGFSNHLQNNRVIVTIKKSGEQLLVFIDQDKIAAYEKAIPAALLFNSISFSSGSSGENNRYYISNIKISKD
ncbi:MAG TPA: hypothetical protein VGC29_10805 [Flavisolibacter sp.]